MTTTIENFFYDFPLSNCLIAMLYYREMDDAAGEFDIAEYYRLHIAVERIRWVM